MTDDEGRSLATRRHSLPAEPGWAREAATVRGPLSAIGFNIRAQANMKAMRTAMQHAQVYGELMKTAAETMEQIHKVNDAARKYNVTQDLAGEYFEAEKERQRERMNEECDQRELVRKQRELELIKAETAILEAKQSHRAKKKFEKLKHAAGEARFATKVAEREGGAAAARAAAADEEVKRRVAEEALGSMKEEEMAGAAQSGKANKESFRERIIARLLALPELIRQASADGDEQRVLDLDEEMRVLKKLLMPEFGSTP